MQVKFRQTTKNGCGSLSIANILDDNRFTLGLEGIPGERIADLNKKLDQHGIEVFIDCLFMTHGVFRTGNRLKLQHEIIFKYTRLTKKVRQSHCVPYLFTLANKGGRNHHMVAAIHSLSDDMFYIIDSTKEKVRVLTFSHLVVDFNIIAVCLLRMWDHPDPANFVSMDKADLPHIFQPKG